MFIIIIQQSSSKLRKKFFRLRETLGALLRFKPHRPTPPHRSANRGNRKFEIPSEEEPSKVVHRDTLPLAFEMIGHELVLRWIAVINLLSTITIVNGQFIRVGFQKEEVVTSSYGNSFDGGNYRQPTTTLSPTIPYWPIGAAGDRHRSPPSQYRPPPTFRHRQKKNFFKVWMTYMASGDYDKYQLPKVIDHEPVEITVSMMIIRVHSLSDASMDYGIELYYREQWNDYRLAFDPLDYDGLDELNLPVIAVNHIWKPDTYFLNAISAEVDSENSVTHKAFFRLKANGDVQYSRKISLKADCPMDLSMYPFDVQSCRLKLGSYSNPSTELSYKWVKKEGHDIEFKDRVELAEFEAERFKTYSRRLNYTTGSFDSLELCLAFKRRAGFCIMQVFFPATAVVMSSWVALWLAEDTTFSDVLAVILAIIFLAYAYNSVMPRVSYVKLLDLYMCSCFLFVFLSLAKLVIIKYFCHKWAKRNNRSYDFFLDQMLGLSAAGATSTTDIEQQSNGDVVSHKGSDSRRSSSSLWMDKKKAKFTRKKSQDQSLNRSCSSNLIKAENGTLPTGGVLANGRLEKRRRSSSKIEADDVDCRTIMLPESETIQNCKNEQIEASFTLIRDETKPLDEEEEEDGTTSEPEPVAPNHVVSPLNPIGHSFAALFGQGGGAGGGGGNTPMTGSAGDRRVTFLGLEAFSAWFESRKKKKGAARCLKYLRYFHVVTQLALPLAFGAFFVFLLLIYPNVPRKNDCS